MLDKIFCFLIKYENKLNFKSKRLIILNCRQVTKVIIMNVNIEKYFSVKNLTEIYNEKIAYSTAVGIDKMTNNYFYKNKNNYIKKISNDILNNKYKLKPYKVILIPKDINTKPRKICIPTIRDRIVIEALKQIIYDYYKDYKINIGISNLVNEFANTYSKKQYSNYIKTDISEFFDTVNHRLLLKQINTVVKDKRIINLIDNIIKNEQQYKKSNYINNKQYCQNKKGIPQGLSISMVLANIYMLNIDNKFKCNRKIKYYRYVDDIFIFCNKNKYIYYFKLKKEILKLKIKLNKRKTRIKKMDKGFDFLGYKIEDNIISVKKQSITKLENSLEEIFKKYNMNKNVEELIWRLNIRISGIITKNKRYGWLFYFNNINDLRLLYHLDDIIEKFKKRYGLENIKTKKFVKTYYKMQTKNLKNSKYFLNIEAVTEAEKKEILKKLTDISEKEINKLSIGELNYIFRKNMFKLLKSLEQDLDSIS